MTTTTQKIIYVLGTGRSGTTLLDIVLGNAPGIVSVGEIVRFPQLRGRPHGFAEETENFRFWQEIGDEFFAGYDPEKDYDALFTIAGRMEAHRYFPLNLLGLTPRRTVARYRDYLNGFFETIFAKTGAEVLVDSSKYPGRALALARYLRYEVYYLHLVRDPQGVVSSFAKKDVEQPSKGLASANLYYFVISAFCALVRLVLPKKRYLRVKFEDLREHPARELQRVAAHFHLSLDGPIAQIQAGQPLRVGPLFEGNRIRLRETISFRASKSEPKLPRFAGIFTNLINRIWYR